MSQTSDIPKAEALRQLRRAGLEISSMRSLGAGDFTRAWLVNGQTVARFARHAEAHAALRREAAVLPWLARQLSVPIPQPEFHQPAEPSALGFVTYPLLGGVPMTRRRFLALSSAERDRFGAQVAQFLDELHAAPHQLPQAQQVPLFDPRQRYAALLEEAGRALLPQLTPAAAQFLERAFHGYLDAAEDAPRRVLLHGDLGPPHILCDGLSPASVAGVIDFGDMQLGPPAWDLVYLYEDLGAEFMRSLLAHFHTENREHALREMYCFYQFDMVAWALRELVGDDPLAAQQALAQLERLPTRARAAPWSKLM